MQRGVCGWEDVGWAPKQNTVAMCMALRPLAAVKQCADCVTNMSAMPLALFGTSDRRIGW